MSFYEEATGTHALRSLTPSLERAWTDMHTGAVRPETIPVSRNGYPLPGGAQPPTVKT